MTIYDITDPIFKEYGRIVDCPDTDIQELLTVLEETTPLPDGIEYVPEAPSISQTESAAHLASSLFGGLPTEFGWCNGHNNKLNCLEYHRSSEFNLATEDIILLLAKQSELQDYKLDTSLVKAFRIPRGVLIEVYATTLHYAPCHTNSEKGFRMLVALPAGTNCTMPEDLLSTEENKLMLAANKWLIAHPDSSEARSGAWVGLSGENIEL